MYVRQLAGESLIYGIPGTIVRAIGFLVLPLYTRFFAPAEYGVIALADVLLLLLGTLTILGLDGAAWRWFYDSDDLADRHTTIATRFWCQLVSSVVGAILLFSFADTLSSLLLGSEEQDRARP